MEKTLTPKPIGKSSLRRRVLQTIGFACIIIALIGGAACFNDVLKHEGSVPPAPKDGAREKETAPAAPGAAGGIQAAPPAAPAVPAAPVVAGETKAAPPAAPAVPAAPVVAGETKAAPPSAAAVPMAPAVAGETKAAPPAAPAVPAAPIVAGETKAAPPAAAVVPAVPAVAGETKAAPPAAEAPAPPLTPEQAASCEKSLAEIRKLFESIPDDYRAAPNLQNLINEVRTCRDRAEEFCRSCRGSPDFPEAQFMLARCILSLNRVEWMNFVNDMRGKGKSNEEVIEMRPDWGARYFGRVIELCSASLERFESGKPLRAKCLDLLGDGLYQDGKQTKALERYQQLLQECPSYPNKAAVYLAMGKCYQELGRYGEGISIIRKAMAELPKDPSFPFFFESLWQLHTGAGDLPGLLKLVEEMRAVLPERLKAEGVGKTEKEAAERTLGYSGFRLGYIRFALGDFSGAADAFVEHIASMEERQNDLEKKGSQLPQDYQVYWTRSKDNLTVLTEKIGKPSPGDMETVLWAGSRKPEIAGKPLALIFRNTGDDRSVKFVQILDRHWRKHRDAYELAVISFLKGTGDSPQVQLDQAFQEAQTMGVECAVGMDPDQAGKQLFRAFNATVGSATFVVVDKAGNYVWFQQDPWQRDERFSAAILDRILGGR